MMPGKINVEIMAGKKKGFADGIHSRAMNTQSASVSEFASKFD